jgi:hypothetical protein
MALVAVLVLMVMLSSLGAALHTGVLGETALQGAHRRSTAAFYAAEAGINRGMGDYRNIFLSYSEPSGSDFDEHSFQIGPFTTRYQLAAVAGHPIQVTVPAGREFAGANAIQYRYTANASAGVQAGDTTVNLGTEFVVNYIPLFQFLAFYQGTLEILPGPTMTLHGPIHTNGNLHLNANNTLTIAELPPTIPGVHVSAAGGIYRGRLDSSDCGGTVRVAKLDDANGDGSLDLRTMPCAGLQSDAALAAWLGAIRGHQLPVSVPTPDILDRGTGLFWERADLRIVLDLDAPDANGLFPIVAEDANGNVDLVRNAVLQQFMLTRPGRVFYNDVPEAGGDLATACTSGTSYCNPASYDPPFPSAAAVYPCAGSTLGLFGACADTVANAPLLTGGLTARRGGFFNNREAAWVYMLNVNLHDLLAWNRLQLPANQLFDPDDASDGGVVLFLSVKGPGSAGVPTPRYGVRVFGSPHFDFPPGMADPTGVTIASDQAVYVEGHYNVGDAAHPKMPAALMGDTINVLSSGWSQAAAGRNDHQSRQSLSNAARAAANTTINAAFLGGVNVTTPGNYNGGLENYLRFHESWSGRTLVYRGSFVSLGTPQHNSGAWCGTGGSSASGCNIYNPPVRNWDYDTDFQTVANLPPLTPRFVAVEQILFTEHFR